MNSKTRPTTSRVREAILNILGENLKKASWLDLCSGSGAMACEVLQKGVTRILAIENSTQTAKLCKLNLKNISNKLDDSVQVEVICKEVIALLKNGPNNKKIKFTKDSPDLEKKFDFIFLDPPYNSKIYEASQEILLSNKWVKRSSTLICECSSKSLPTIHNGWEINKQKNYGNTSIIFLTPNQALNCFDDTDSKH
tara:strand:+ start:2713 stop:3300 length:588 start_codon:yes stop_codon:yes gene_type:complete